MKKALVIITAIILVASGCLPSLYPLYTPQDVVFNKDLIGVWNESNSDNKWIFEDVDSAYYLLTHMEDESKSFYQAHLLQLKDHYFLDIYPVEEEEWSTMKQIHFFPVHTFSRVHIVGDKLSINMLDPSWFESIMEEGGDVPDVKLVRGQMLLTANTAELQAFVIRHAENRKAFANSVNLIRAK